MTSFPLVDNISTTCTTLLLTIFILSMDVCAKVFYEQRLLTSLLRDYNPRARPVDELDDTIDVNVTFHLTKVVGLDTKDQILQTSGWLQLIWTDSRLTWDPSQYGNIELIAFLPTDVWFPSFALENSAGAFHDFNHHRLFRISARYDGLMVWEPAGSFLTFCPIDVTFYPFDTQTCTLTFVDWVYSDGKVRLELGSDEIYTDATYYQQSGEWRIQKTWAFWERIRYEENNETFSRVSFVVVIHRQYIHYFVNLLFPSFILSFLVLLVYFVPRSMGEKLGMGVTLMMSYFVFNLSVAEDVPKSADHTPLIQVYLVFYMSTTALTIAVTIMMLWLNHTPHVGPPPEWLRFIVYQVFARVICYGKMCGTTKFKNRSKEDEEILEMQMKQTKDMEGGVSPAPSGLTASALVEIAKFASTTAALNEDIEETRGLAESKDVNSTSGARISSVDADIKSKLKSVEKKSKAVLSSLFEAVKKEAKAKSINRIKEEWTEITKIINAFAFCVLFSVTIVFIIVFGILWIIIDFR